MRGIRAIPHLTLILSTMCLVLFVLDKVNSNMRFMMNEITKWVVAALSVCAIITSVLCIGGYLRADEAQEAAERARRLGIDPDKPQGPRTLR